MQNLKVNYQKISLEGRQGHSGRHTMRIMDLQLFAHKKGVGSSRNGRDSNPKMLGVKKYGGEVISAGSIIVRQRGTKIHPGQNVGRGKDDTLFALTTGAVTFERLGKTKKQVSVYPLA